MIYNVSIGAVVIFISFVHLFWGFRFISPEKPSRRPAIMLPVAVSTGVSMVSLLPAIICRLRLFLEYAA